MNMKLVVPLLISAVLLPSLSHGEGLLKYHPPKTGAPLTLTGGGTRGFGSKPLQVLAPRHTALTSESQPVLYWYSSQEKQQKLQVSILKEGVAEPILQKQLIASPGEGLQSFRLADYGIKLQPGDVYRWSVALNDAEQASGDAISHETYAKLRYQLPTAPLSSVEQQVEAGYWYDALQQLIESNSPLTSDLLAQVGLKLPMM